MNRTHAARWARAVTLTAMGALLASCSTSGSSTGTTTTGAKEGFKPTKAVSLFVGYDPGGSGDAIARELALLLQKDLGVAINVQNRAGASGAQATTELLQQKPDGYSIAVAPSSQLTVTPLISNDTLSFKDANDWTTIAGLLDQQNGILARPESGWKDIKDFIAAAKASPGQLTVGVPSVSGANAMAVASLEKAAGIQVKIVPFSGGSGESSVALLGGQVSAICATLSGQLGLIKAGKLMSLGHSGDQPYTEAASTPLSAQGFPITNLANTVYYAYGPKGMPADVLETWTAEFKKLQGSEAFTAWLKKNNYNPHPTYGSAATQELLQASTDAKEGVQLLTAAGLNLSKK